MWSELGLQATSSILPVAGSIGAPSHCPSCGQLSDVNKQAVRQQRGGIMALPPTAISGPRGSPVQAGEDLGNGQCVAVPHGQPVVLRRRKVLQKGPRGGAAREARLVGWRPAAAGACGCRLQPVSSRRTCALGLNTGRAVLQGMLSENSIGPAVC